MAPNPLFDKYEHRVKSRGSFEGVSKLINANPISVDVGVKHVDDFRSIHILARHKI